MPFLVVVLWMTCISGRTGRGLGEMKGPFGTIAVFSSLLLLLITRLKGTDLFRGQENGYLMRRQKEKMTRAIEKVNIL